MVVTTIWLEGLAICPAEIDNLRIVFTCIYGARKR